MTACLANKQLNCSNNHPTSRSPNETLEPSQQAQAGELPPEARDPSQLAHMLAWDDLLHGEGDDDDDDGDDEDEDEEEETERNFYSPTAAGEFAGSGDMNLKSGDFRDFDDHEALRTAEFYPTQNRTLPPLQTKSPANKRRRMSSGGPGTGKVRRTGGNATSGRYLAEESHQSEGGALARQCAVVLERAGCITFGAVEWAIRRARRIIGFERPDDLNSPEPSEASVNVVGELNELTSRILAQRFNLNWLEVASDLGQIDIRRTSLWRSCPLIFRLGTTCLAQSRYRTHTGQCNNLLAPYLGSSFMPFSRALPADYADSVGLPRRSSLSGGQLPPARLLASHLHPDLPAASGELSALFTSWGQLVNHDLAMASGARPATGHDSQCCGRTSSGSSRYSSSSERVCMPIQVPPGDPLYGPLGIRCLDFKRSLAGLRPGCALGPRIQLNTISSFVDASFVYGSRRSSTAALRRNQRGLLNTWQYFEPPRKPLLPPQTENPDEECRGRRNRRFCFLSGDARTNQQVQLAALHTYHTRQHNRLARALQIINPHWSDNRLYHEARHIHIALVQHILLSEYLPLLLGPKLLAKHELEESPEGQFWDHYAPEVNPSITQAFAAAAFRQGHSSVPGEVYRFNQFHEPVRVYQLRQLFRQPWPLYEPGALDEFLLGMVNAPAAALDPFVSIQLSGHLLQEPGERIGLDLVAINIQRGRDQGVAGYNAFRDWCGLERAGSFAELANFMDNRTSSLLSQLYETPDDVDLFTGGLAEFPLPGAQVGPTFGCIIGRQFGQLRAGDRFWFEASQGPQAFTLNQLDSIKRVSLARLLCANSDSVITIQQWALQQPHPVLNPRAACSELPDLDISLWQELSK